MKLGCVQTAIPYTIFQYDKIQRTTMENIIILYTGNEH